MSPSTRLYKEATATLDRLSRKPAGTLLSGTGDAARPGVTAEDVAHRLDVDLQWRTGWMPYPYVADLDRVRRTGLLLRRDQNTGRQDAVTILAVRSGDGTETVALVG